MKLSDVSFLHFSDMPRERDDVHRAKADIPPQGGDFRFWTRNGNTAARTYAKMHYLMFEH